MEIFHHDDVALHPADPATFVGAADIKRLASSAHGTPVTVYRVEFEAGGRTNWHTHTGPQWLFVIEGRIRVQPWGASARDVTVGDAVVFGPGEKHWHGAVPGTRGVHLAVNVNATTEWLEPVSDEQYQVGHP